MGMAEVALEDTSAFSEASGRLAGATVLIVDDEPGMRNFLSKTLARPVFGIWTRRLRNWTRPITMC
jgi:hypothetical protein